MGSKCFSCLIESDIENFIHDVISLCKGKEISHEQYIEKLDLLDSNNDLRIKFSDSNINTNDKKVVPPERLNATEFIISTLSESKNNLVKKILPDKNSLNDNPLFNCLSKFRFRLRSNLVNCIFTSIMYTLPLITLSNGYSKGELVFNLLSKFFITYINQNHFVNKRNINGNNGANLLSNLNFPINTNLRSQSYRNTIESKKSGKKIKTKTKKIEMTRNTIIASKLENEKTMKTTNSNDSLIIKLNNSENLDQSNKKLNHDLIMKFFFFYSQITVVHILSKLVVLLINKMEKIMLKNQTKKDLVLLEKVVFDSEILKSLKLISQKFRIETSLLLYEKLSSDFQLYLKESKTCDYKYAFIRLESYFNLEFVASYCINCINQSDIRVKY